MTAEQNDALHSAPAYETGRCRVCDREMRVRKNGTIGHHGGEQRGQWPYGRTYRCEGAGLRPAGQETTNEAP